MSDSKTLYIGYDLGDAETQLSYLSPNSRTPDSPLMPTTMQNGQPMITAYGKKKDESVVLGNDLINGLADDLYDFSANFKVKPTEAIKVLPIDVQENLYDCCHQGKADRIIELYRLYDSPEFIMPRRVREFTDALFSHERIKTAISAFMDKCDSIEVLVGHPTKWNRDDLILYRAMLHDTILGADTFEHQRGSSSVRLSLEAESRAAFLYGRCSYAPGGATSWNLANYVLVIDVGSSTIDVSAMSGLDPDTVYDDGQPYLGARLIDQSIYEKYKSKLKDMGRISTFEHLQRKIPTIEKFCMLACRKGKEEYFSLARKVAKISPDFDDIEHSLPDIKISKDEMEELLRTPVRLLNDNGEWCSGGSWQEEFKSFLQQQKATLNKQKKIIDRIILTGGAARMGFIPETCKQVFADIPIIEDVNPGAAISYGLALVGRSNEKSAAFRRDAESFLDNELVSLIKTKVSKLGGRISGPIASLILDDITLHELRRWRSGSHRTLNAAMNAIKSRCNEENLKQRLDNDSDYNNAIHEWIISDLIGSINAELAKLKDKHGLSELSIEHVDITNLPVNRMQNLPSIDGASIPSGLLDPVDSMAGYLAIVTGVVAFTVMPTIIIVVLYVMLVVIATISTTLASIIISILAAIPGAGWTILAILGGVSVFWLMINGWESMKEKISNAMMSYNLPQWVRTLVPEEKFSSVISKNRSEVINKIENGICSDSTPKQIADNVAVALKPMIEAKITEIRYLIESKAG